MSAEIPDAVIEWFNDEVRNHNEEKRRAGLLYTLRGEEDRRVNFLVGEVVKGKQLLDGARAALVAGGVECELLELLEDEAPDLEIPPNYDDD